MTTVILAEKPSQALAYAQAFQNHKKEDGYFTVKDSLFSDETFITFGFGHLVELAPPSFYNEKWGKWSLESLPIFPSNYSFEVSKDKQKQFKIVSKLLNKANTIIIATDSDREGSNIAWSIIHKANSYDNTKSFKRLWINSLEKEAIREGFKNLKNGEEDIPAYLEAQTRQISDWLIGMNGSPLYTLNLQGKGVNGTFTLGRVQTPTLYMIYQRQQEIENFKKIPYFEIDNSVSNGSDSFKANLVPLRKFESKEEADRFLDENKAKLGGQKGVISNVEVKQKSSNSPTLFSLSSLQSKINSLYKASASDTLKAVQKLYEAKLLTYPRTDTHFITDNEFAYLQENINKYRQFLNIKEEAVQLTPRKRYVDNDKVQEHHAIVLTKQVPTEDTFLQLTDLQKKVYLLVAKTTVAMFLPNYEYEETTIDIQTGNLKFRAKGQVPLKYGWKSLFKEEKQEEKQVLLPKVTVGSEVKATLKITEKETQPPKYFTEGTLLTAMKTAGKTVDDEEAQLLLKDIEGIGTEATRASIIDSLKAREYIENKKNKLYVTEKGKILCKAVENQHLLTSAEMTAKWESYLRKIGKREGSQDKFLNNIKKFIIHLLENVPKDIQSLDIKEYENAKQNEIQRNTIGKCPKCSGDIILKKSFYGCNKYPECKFTIPDNFRKKKLTKTNLKDLLQGKETLVKGIKTKEKDTYNANVKLNSKGYIEFVSFGKKESN